MFPPELKSAVDGWPIVVQVAIYSFLLFCFVASAGGAALLARRRENKPSDSVVLSGFNASIADMGPVREGVELMRIVVAQQRTMIDNQGVIAEQQRRMIRNQEGISDSLGDLVRLLKLSYQERD